MSEITAPEIAAAIAPSQDAVNLADAAPEDGIIQAPAASETERAAATQTITPAPRVSDVLPGLAQSDAEDAVVALAAPSAGGDADPVSALDRTQGLTTPEAAAQTAPAVIPGQPERLADAPDGLTAPGIGATEGVSATAVADPALTALAPDAAAAPERLPEPTVLLRTARGVEVLQTAPLAPGDVALDAISYDAEGDVLLSGRGEEDAFVRIYLDNAPLTTSVVDDDGRWRVTLPDVDTGTYTLRVDQVDAEGSVVARVESPFLRESAAILAAAFGGEAAVQSVTVQPGNTLWAIAKGRYGDGLDYVKVFDANRDRIRNPDLIYPGQIFDLPTD
ncbi:LysM peptidoglycan-binding domain-containing protein [Cognatishimia sp. F0-27]|nr:LysM peptidoglycan-binding domain-containing protein [Cognatishimia sp. F0-27]